jgi:hypothetical protein
MNEGHSILATIGIGYLYIALLGPLPLPQAKPAVSIAILTIVLFKRLNMVLVADVSGDSGFQNCDDPPLGVFIQHTRDRADSSVSW